MTVKTVLNRTVPLAFLLLSPALASGEKAIGGGCGAVQDQWRDNTWPAANDYAHADACFMGWNSTTFHSNDNNWHSQLVDGLHSHDSAPGYHPPC